MIAGVHLGYGRTNYSQVLGDKNVSSTEWSSGLWASYNHEDLLFTGVYQASLGLKEFDASRHLGHVGVSYRFLEEDMLTVYGGLGYQLVSARFETPQVDAGQRHSLTGHGFAGQVVVDIAITDEFRTTAMVAANPWTRWSHTFNKNTDSNIDSGNAFIYRLELNYDFSTEFGAHLSVLGNTYSVPAFSRNQETIGETKSSSASINLGVTRHF
jgi:hypothetical protein